MSDEQGAVSQTVRKQYEQFPYPPRDPERERQRLLPTNMGSLAAINHHCFGGRQDFRGGFRVLVAGGGTGDATVYLAEQLRETDGEVVHVDLSEQSMAVARARADVRGLENIRWVRDSLLDLPRMGLGEFDYIDCTGVLHHLDSPEDGLAALRAVLKDDGAMLLMLYARYGRVGIYHMQDLMRIVNGDEEDPAKKVANTKAVLDAVPETNWFKRSRGMFIDLQEFGDAGLYDMFLHSTDRAYSIPEVYELVDSAALEVIVFSRKERALFSPGLAYDDRGLGELLAHLPEKQRQAAIELACGLICKHALYVAQSADRAAKLDEPDMIPAFYPAPFGKQLYKQLAAHPPNTPLTINGPGGMILALPVGSLTAAVVKQIDGRRTLPEIAREARRGHPARPSRNDILAELERLYARLRIWDLLLLRHASVALPAT